MRAQVEIARNGCGEPHEAGAPAAAASSAPSLAALRAAPGAATVRTGPRPARVPGCGADDDLTYHSTSYPGNPPVTGCLLKFGLPQCRAQERLCPWNRQEATSSAASSDPEAGCSL